MPDNTTDQSAGDQPPVTPDSGQGSPYRSVLSKAYRRGTDLPVNDPQELYATVRRAIEALRSAGDLAAARDLDSALHLSNVGSEVMGELRIELWRLKASGVPVRRGISDEVDMALNYLDLAMRRLFG
jgi:hypothetical protein